MAKLSDYKGSIDLISGIRPKNNGTFPLMEAHDILVGANDKRLDTALAELAAGGGGGGTGGGILNLIVFDPKNVTATDVIDACQAILNGTLVYVNGNIASAIYDSTTDTYRLATQWFAVYSDSDGVESVTYTSATFTVTSGELTYSINEYDLLPVSRFTSKIEELEERLSALEGGT